MQEHKVRVAKVLRQATEETRSVSLAEPATVPTHHTDRRPAGEPEAESSAAGEEPSRLFQGRVKGIQCKARCDPTEAVQVPKHLLPGGDGCSIDKARFPWW